MAGLSASRVLLQVGGKREGEVDQVTCQYVMMSSPAAGAVWRSLLLLLRRVIVPYISACLRSYGRTQK